MRPIGEAAALGAVWAAPALPPAEFERIKAAAIARLEAAQKDPAQVAANLASLRFDNYPPGHPLQPRSLDQLLAEAREIAPNTLRILLGNISGFDFAAQAVAPEHMPILDRWNTEIVKVLNDEGVKKALNAHGLTPQPTTRQGLADFMKKEYEQWGKVVQERKLSAN